MKTSRINFTADINKPQAPVLKAENTAKTGNADSPKPSAPENKNGRTLLLATLGGLALVGMCFALRPKPVVPPDLTELTLETMKKYRCRFRNGKLLMPDESGFSGQFVHKPKDGGKIVREYKNGIIQKSTKFLNDEKVWSKEYIGGRIGVINRPMETVIYPIALETVPPKALPSHVA